MSSIEAAKNKDEKLIFSTKPSILPVFISWETIVFFGFVIFMNTFGAYFSIHLLEIILIVLIALIIFIPEIRLLLKLSAITYKLTNKNVVSDSRLSSRDRKTIPINTIKSVKVKQSVLGLLLNSGNIIIKTIGNKNNIQLINVPNCGKRARQISDILKEKSN